MSASRPRTIGLVAHDDRKADLVAWALAHRAFLEGNTLYATGTTGGRILEAMPDLDLTRFKSGPLGGDQQLGALIAEGRLDVLIFFVDPLSPQPHDVDVKALIRMATLANIPFACNPATADLIAQGF
ncbi:MULTISPECIES: methylglyoxal synthase [unclassified Caulobacter]|uniref:methylglyoxal synthase n=1 Tax=unclassified Caulobacter TaxID=2648921 RepID=UPI001E290AD5|nr:MULTISPECIES: methylglyoxal synthase [unclassified Caulobacter]